MLFNNITFGLLNSVFIYLTSYELFDLMCTTFDDGFELG